MDQYIEQELARPLALKDAWLKMPKEVGIGLIPRGYVERQLDRLFGPGGWSYTFDLMREADDKSVPRFTVKGSIVCEYPSGKRSVREAHSSATGNLGRAVDDAFVSAASSLGRLFLRGSWKHVPVKIALDSGIVVATHEPRPGKRDWVSPDTSTRLRELWGLGQIEAAPLTIVRDVHAQAISEMLRSFGLERATNPALKAAAQDVLDCWRALGVAVVGPDTNPSFICPWGLRVHHLGGFIKLVQKAVNAQREAQSIDVEPTDESWVEEEFRVSENGERPEKEVVTEADKAEGGEDEPEEQRSYIGPAFMMPSSPALFDKSEWDKAALSLQELIADIEFGSHEAVEEWLANACVACKAGKIEGMASVTGLTMEQVCERDNARRLIKALSGFFGRSWLCKRKWTSGQINVGLEGEHECEIVGVREGSKASEPVVEFALGAVIGARTFRVCIFTVFKKHLSHNFRSFSAALGKSPSDVLKEPRALLGEVVTAKFGQVEKGRAKVSMIKRFVIGEQAGAHDS